MSKEMNMAQAEQELRRHLSGLVQACVDAAHIWCSAETHITATSAGFRAVNADALWLSIPDHLMTVLLAIEEITRSDTQPQSLVWWEWRNALETTTHLIETRTSMLQEAH